MRLHQKETVLATKVDGNSTLCTQQQVCVCVHQNKGAAHGQQMGPQWLSSMLPDILVDVRKCLKTSTLTCVSLAPYLLEDVATPLLTA